MYSFLSENSFSTLFIRTNSSLLILQSIKDLEIKTSMIFNLEFNNNTIASCFFFFFLIIDLYFLIPEVITQIANPITELVIPIGIPTKEAKAGMETYQVIVETKIINCSI